MNYKQPKLGLLQRRVLIHLQDGRSRNVYEISNEIRYGYAHKLDKVCRRLVERGLLQFNGVNYSLFKPLVTTITHKKPEYTWLKR